MAKGQFEHVLVPVASDTDAESTAEALADHLETDRVTVVHVVEKAGGAPDKAGVEQREEAAAEAFERFEETYGESVETDIVYDSNIADGLLAAAAEAGRCSGKSPPGLAAAAIYTAAVLENEECTQEAVAEVARVTVVTVRNRYQEQLDAVDPNHRARN